MHISSKYKFLQTALNHCVKSSNFIPLASAKASNNNNANNNKPLQQMPCMTVNDTNYSINKISKVKEEDFSNTTSTITNTTSTTINTTNTTNSKDRKENKKDNSNKPIPEISEKTRLKEEKKKKMQNICNQSEKSKAQKKFIEQIKFVNTTPFGHKKDMSVEMLPKYDPNAVECAWDSWWTQEKIYEVSAEKAEKYPIEKRFTMLLPPPNVTGKLHLGHTLMGAVEDSLTRWKRMKGFCALWIPGTDHAGISCQTVVEKKIKKEEGKFRKDFSREEFLAKVFEWKYEYGNKIFEQFRRLGVSFDWSRAYFTMDEDRSKSVSEAFIRLYEKRLLYRAKRIVHWCCTLNTTISDVEIDDENLEGPTMIKVPNYTKEIEFGVLIKFAYKIKGDESKEIVVATTRIETMLGDVAVAVNSKDPRYKDFVGKSLVHPFIPDREMKVITDDILVDMAFGTGAVKITPSHDPNDFECGKRNNLEFINILDDSGNINHNGGMFAGTKRYDCREAIQVELKKLGLHKGKESNPMVLQKCSKSGDIIEPLIKPQWWINCKDVAARGVKDVETGKLKIVPDFQKTLWNSFLNNIRDWCVSRQLWWGHRCPAYLVTIKGKQDPDESNNEHWICATSEKDALAKAVKKYNVDASLITLKQDEDVLDTWFSSALLPISLCGWPDENHKDFKMFFPSSVLETGHDIIFFWVARMVFFSYFFMEELPFETVYLHPIVRDAQGRKMSKSLGNVIDPLEVIDGIPLDTILSNLKSGNLPDMEVKKCSDQKKKEFPQGIPTCGADALRLGLMSYMIQGKNINLDIGRVVGYRHFGNKLWNAVKFFLSFLDEEFKPNHDLFRKSNNNSFINLWMLNKQSRLVKQFDAYMEQYSFGDAVRTVYSYWQDFLCDVYIEAIKPIFKNGSPEEKEITRNVLHFCIDSGLKVLHPLMPFVTEELFQRLNYEINKILNLHTTIITPSISLADFPSDESFINDEVDKLGLLVSDISHRILGLAPQFEPKDKANKKKLSFSVFSTDNATEKLVLNESGLIATLAKVASVQFVKSKSGLDLKTSLVVVYNETTDLIINLTDFNYSKDKEADRLKSELDDKTKRKNEIITKMTDKGYENNASEQVKKINKEKLAKLEAEIEKIDASLKNFN